MMKTDHPKEEEETKPKKNLTEGVSKQLRILEEQTGEQDQAQERVQEPENSLHSFRSNF